ncbi:MAG: DegT/DnrJ/EryC1/StrS family aminotransferase [Candidatus Brockarchaeota archaeon]|nr:DegT/DnrJ/EryC1/StrS family aminotransferase [Candidatus Brockarchaeota archaeon]
MPDLALLGGSRAVKTDPGDMFTWPIVTKEVEEAVLEVLRAGKMSDIDVTQRFEEEFAKWHGVKYALAHNNGTSAIHSAMFGLGIGHGDEVICPSLTYWASCLPVYSLGGTVVFADVDPETLCIDPKDVERRITERTKAIVAVHYTGMPADMDAIMEIARRRRLKVIEDASHAHGALYKGRLVGTIGDVACFSIMSGKSFAAGEGGMMITNDRRVYERAVVFGHYERHSSTIQLEDLKAGAGLPWGGYKYRMHQLTSAVGIVQLKKYKGEMEEIDRAMNYFWDRLEGVPGMRAHRPPRGSGTTKGGWYAPLGHYKSEELGGLSIHRFCEALRAEGVPSSPGGNQPLHLHPIFNTIDVDGQGRPTSVDVRQPPGSLPVSESVGEKIFSVPWFKHYRPKVIDEYVEACRKVAENYEDLLPGDVGRKEGEGGWGLTSRLRRR